MICQCGRNGCVCLQSSLFFTLQPTVLLPWSAYWSVLRLPLLLCARGYFQGKAKHMRRWEATSSNSDTLSGYILTHVPTEPNCMLQRKLDPLYYVNRTSIDFSKWWWRKKIGCKIHLKVFCLSPSILWMSPKGKEIVIHSDQYHFPHWGCCKLGRFLIVL